MQINDKSTENHPKSQIRMLAACTVSSVITSGMIKTGKPPEPLIKKDKGGDDLFGTAKAVPSSKPGRMYKAATPQRAVDLLRDAARRMGGNGLINLKVTYIPATVTIADYSNYGYSASAMAIKINDNAQTK